ncbi:hypothetical protein TNCV_3100171 [Trichonephila clavipes]|nr:hypothetical protein TNCV_3100171 [Trichonephila clavipes]
MGGRSEPTPVNRLVISSARIPIRVLLEFQKTVALGLVLQLGCPLGELADRIPNRYYYTQFTSEVSAVPDACQMTGGLPPCWAPWWWSVLG